MFFPLWKGVFYGFCLNIRSIRSIRVRKKRFSFSIFLLFFHLFLSHSLPSFFSKIKTNKNLNLEREPLVFRAGPPCSGPSICTLTSLLGAENTCFFLLFYRKMHILAHFFLKAWNCHNSYGEIALYLHHNWTSAIQQLNVGCIATEWQLHFNWMVVALQ